MYSLSGKYNRLTGTVFVNENNKNKTGTASFEIYGDNQLLYTSPDISTGFLPQSLDIDISNVQTLKIKIYGITDYESHGIADMFDGDPPNICISDFQASRTDLPQPATETQPAA